MLGVGNSGDVAYLGSSGWLVFGGTSVSAPIIGSVYALSGKTPGYANALPALRAHNSPLRRHLRIKRQLSDASVVHRPNWLGRTVWPGNAQRRERVLTVR